MKDQSGQSGLTVIEIIIAMTIILLGMLPVFKLYDVLMTQGALQKQRGIAIQIASEIMEQEKKSYLVKHTYGGPFPKSIRTTQDRDGISYSIDLTYDSIEDSTKTQLLHVTVVVTWPRGEYDLTTYFTSR
ncbi:prepilin-type N-terminal cleavage/methylation domain-containing protein [Heliomicrobium modesticaldum]|uniref:prepilin-type N-terminal cleavage/methylation domain-containing protein n=1 Tax=Heliomicrobium modesticaldum TaxID=35701 RepID=UPI00059CAB62|nr:prepilin-type N-terminal cleavage/methylation domain-containing protein [Heliomicrobium modesticaldum]